MAGFIILVIMIGSSAVGYYFNRSYEDKYGEPAINWAAFVLQALFILCALFTWPNPDVSFWFIVWCLLSLISYVVAVIACKQHAEQQGALREDIKKAIAAQILLPVGTAIVILLAIAMVLGVLGGGKKKR
ncbi:hypothetical protein bpr_IV148 (plasmid) [Butyrivibrio proteoclasticus B316]|uniref:Uncharacterized protein n=1 Tax=Butyrivibrio proteoclasticus (strain ATCC 51982 / DSM 14932 / B316) TaxID=515622 RepID=E0S530_BUTPB|nr:hypothetical protein [Butyrivibrio proteoclasticus]ADL36512.1 hypothetical protein bpr_IV148 [Butyrivibrio proteoclasticus B316]